MSEIVINLYENVEFIEFEVKSQEICVIEKSVYKRDPDRVKPIKGTTRFRFFNQHQIVTSNEKTFFSAPENYSSWYYVKN